MVICLERGANDLSDVQLMPMPPLHPVVKVRGNAGERRSWAHNNCWRAFPGPTQPLVVRDYEQVERAPSAYSRAPIFSEFLGP